MADDELVRKYNLQAPGQGGGTAREAGVIFKLAARLKPPVRPSLLHLALNFNPSQVETVSLANNNLNGQHLTYLDKYLPRVAHLSLQNNNLRSWRDVDPISSRREKLLHLRELVLMGNPLREQEYRSGNSERYKRCA
jgi:nuclear RNA export factor